MVNKSSFVVSTSIWVALQYCSKREYAKLDAKVEFIVLYTTNNGLWLTDEEAAFIDHVRKRRRV